RTAGEPASITVLAAASTTDAIHDIAEAFETSHPGVAVRISTGPSNSLAQQVIAGAPADIYLSANMKWADAVAEQGLAEETVELLTNRMVLVVPRGNPAGVKEPGDLVGPGVTMVALAGENVPAGIYAEQALRQLQLLDELREGRKLARGADVRITLAYVERGEAEAGIVYATDARISDQVEVVAELDPMSHDQVTYPVVLLKAAKDKTAARQFLRFLQSAEAQTVFERYGFSRLGTRP
ncbi:MAG: molybdate ABC transporter substrate-binding protein, partial [Pirellulaceae bacterium]|nr:molybdate ABC transporter substrate-binding protein [Pirellulaceae bacterium]